MVRGRGSELTPSEKALIAQFLLANSSNCKVHSGKIVEASASFGVSRRTIHNVWQAAKKQVLAGQPMVFKSNKQGITHESNRKLQLNEEMMMAIPYSKRGTMRRLAKEMKCSKSAIGRWVKSGEIQPHTNQIKPTITDANKFQRLQFCLSSLKADNFSNKIKFTSMHNVIHIDEKWFYMSRAMERCYKLKSEIGSYRSCKSKRYIPKVMFMCAVSRPQYSSDGELVFDGKIGIFPFTKQEPAKRNSKNRLRGTMMTVPLDSITKEVTKNCLINQIIPAIKQKWPTNATKNIMIQQDNARPHIHNNDPEFRAAASSDGFNIQLVCQPPNSPDTNINDLGWFRAIQSIQVETSSYNVKELLENVVLSFEKLKHSTLNNLFLSLQNCMVEIMKVKGHNNCKEPHMGKDHLIRQGILPEILEVDEDLVRGCIEHLIEAGQIEDSAYNFDELKTNLGY